ncbi:MAG: ABC transporter permease [Clostridia bacterium]|nr:ABC transporter permease [Clostridia bacterium]
MSVNKDKFVLVQNKFEDVDKIETQSLTFWQDAWRRLRKNKGAMFGLAMIFVLIIFAIAAPMEPFVPNNADGTPFSYKKAPVLFDEEGNEIAKEDISFVPPRIPGIEKLGIFDGFTVIERGSWDILIGNLPKTTEWDALKSPLKRKDLIAALGIPYHPFEINFIDMFKKDGVNFAKVKVLATGEIVELPYADLISEFTRFQDGTFEYVSSEVDDKGVEMIKINADYYEIQNIKNLYFWFGTDKLALDVWTRLWTGVRVSLLIALASMVLDFSMGIVYGTVAGFYAGTIIDTIMMRFTEIIGSIPMLVFMIIMISLIDPIETFISGIFPNITYTTVRLLIIIVAMSLTGWIGVSRVVRAQILKLRDQEFILASRTLGASKIRLMQKHLFPNIIGQLVVMMTFTIPGAIYYEAFLTFIGMGLPIPMASLGVLLRDGYNSIQTIPAMLLIPSFIMSLLMLSINLLANGLRDALDPRMR